MSLSDDKSSSLARNRDNQRRARERRQKYIKELEQRTREYETAGVQATVEVQAAAKKVVDENARLRNLLQHVGVTSDQIDFYLQAGEIPSYVPHMPQDVPPIIPKSNALTPPAEKRNNRQERLEASEQLVQMSIAPSIKPAGLASAQQATPCSPTSEVNVVARPDETSCIDAAQIIASMRGLSDSQEVWSELGCSNTRSCRVKNTELFQMMDR